MAKPITAEKFTSPFRFLDAKLAEFKKQRTQVRDALKGCGWILRPNHPISMVWRARRHSNGTHHLSAPTADGLVGLARKEAEPRIAAHKAREAARAENKAQKAAA